MVTKQHYYYHIPHEKTLKPADRLTEGLVFGFKQLFWQSIWFTSFDQFDYYERGRYSILQY